MFLRPTAAADLPRVLVVSSTLDDDGGVPVCAGRLAAALAGLGVPVEVCGQHAGEPAPVIVAPCGAAGVPVRGVREPWDPAGQWRAAGRVRGIVTAAAAAARAERRRLVVHLHGVWVAPVIAAAMAAVSEEAWLVVSPHGMLRAEALRKSRWRKRVVWEGWLRRLLVAAESLHVTSAAEGDDLRLLLPGCRPKLLPLGITVPEPAPRRDAAGAPRVAGALGRILPIKNLDGLLRAWAVAAPRGWRLSIAGPGPAEARESLRALARSLGIAAEVELGDQVPLDAVGRHFAGLDLFVLPSHSEAFALVVGEALGSGVPAIVSTAAPWEGVVRHGCGWSVPPSVPALAAALAEATSLPGDRLAAMGERGREWIRTEYAWSRIAARHLRELYGHAGPLPEGDDIRDP